MKSHGRRMKSDWMRLEKCRRTVPVPMLLSCDSSKVWTSMRRPVEEELMSESMWWEMAVRCAVGQITRTSEGDERCA